MKIESSPATAPNASACTPATCRLDCAIEVIDSLLRTAGAARGDEVDALLDLRWLLRRRDDAEAALRLFCQLRRSMEERQYLAFFRLRRWLENQIEAGVQLHRHAPERLASLKLDRYCIEAVRHQCLQSVREPEVVPVAPRVRFVFRPVSLAHSITSSRTPEAAQS